MKGFRYWIVFVIAQAVGTGLLLISSDFHGKSLVTLVPALFALLPGSFFGLKVVPKSLLGIGPVVTMYVVTYAVNILFWGMTILSLRKGQRRSILRR